VLGDPVPRETPPLGVQGQVDAAAQRFASRLPGRNRAQVEDRQGDGQAAGHDGKTARTGITQQAPSVSSRSASSTSRSATKDISQVPEHDVQADKAVLGMVEGRRCRPDDLESERLPQMHSRSVRLDDRIELDAGKAR
jgi:hypothetical protein